MFRDDPKLTLKDLVRRDTKYYFNHLESKILTNWIWGPRQNMEVTKTIIQPVEKVRINMIEFNFDWYSSDIIWREKHENYTESDHDVEILHKIFAEVCRLSKRLKMFRRLHFRPELLISMSLDNFEKLQKFVSDDSDYEAQFAYGKEIFDDFNYNVGRKMHIIKSTIKV